jgi:hypothetical protein
MKKDDVNRKYTPTWVYCNDNSRASYYRNQFIAEHGGKFVKADRNYFKWEQEQKIQVIRRKFIFEDRNGIVFIVENMYDFCKRNDLKRAAMYECIAQKRKSHKGFKFIAEIPWTKAP